MSYFCFEIVWQLDIQLPTQSVSITTNTTRVEVYSMQHYVIKFVSDLWEIGGFLWVLQFPPRYNWNIVESGIEHHIPKPPWDFENEQMIG
jgi:hypothetical protein